MRFTNCARLSRASALVLLLGVQVCGDLPHTNPFDPAVPVSLTIVGPDTITAQLDTLIFTVRSDPAFSFPEPDWQPSSPLVKMGLGTFLFPSLPPSSSPNGVVTVTAKLGPRTVSRTVVVQMRAATIRPCVGVDTLRFTALQATVSLCTYYGDRHGVLLDATSLANVPVTSYKVNDETVAQSGSGAGTWNGAENRQAVTGLKVGATGITVSGAGASITIPIKVTQQPVSLRIAECDFNGHLGVVKAGQQIQLHVTGPYDANGYLVTNPAAVQAALSNLVWSASAKFDGLVFGTITPDGLLTAGPSFGVGTIAVFPMINGVRPPGSLGAGCDFHTQ